MTRTVYLHSNWTGDGSKEFFVVSNVYRLTAAANGRQPYRAIKES